ncbi:hypothetical protein [uncultured Proteiniphilum sp.]|uniref:helix-turn-helix domain-containing protein n=1 Tax=uncultured Proteiniphilum sp. TaxID=497637 RepID=UPI00262AD2FA|nr:hypothetical protein [uncultured Proteiniphilum sp.]
MVNLDTYFQGVITLIPVFSAITCAVLVALAVRENFVGQRRKPLYPLCGYFVADILVWLYIFCWCYIPGFSVFLNIPFFMGLVLGPVLLYQTLSLSVNSGNNQKISIEHFIFPVLTTIAVIILSLRTPLDVQVTVAIQEYSWSAGGYDAWAFVYYSEPVLGIISRAIYTLLSAVLVFRGYKQVESDNLKNKLRTNRIRRFILIVVIMGVILLPSCMLTFVSRADIYTSVWTYLLAAATFLLHILLAYVVVWRNGREQPLAVVEVLEVAPLRKLHRGKLSKWLVESYFRGEKPHLDPHFKITDMVKDMDVNRTIISRFINQHYGLNFNRFVNRWRLAELETLAALTVNKDKKTAQLVTKAGFSNMKHYQRALRAVNDPVSPSENKTGENE